MQNKGAIRLFAILLALVCVYQLAFTYVSGKVEKQAKEYAKGDKMKELFYLDSISGETVYNLLGIRKYTYKEVKELEMNLGLDLKGGMNVTLEVSVVDLIKALSNYSKDPTFNAAITRAKELQGKSQDDFVTLFGKAFNEIDPNARLAAIFNTLELKDKVKYNSTNAEVLKVIREQTDAAIDNSFNIIRTRIDRFGVAQPNVQPLQTKGRILVELPGVDDPKRVRKLLQGTANLEFWETYENSEIYESMLAVNAKLKEIQDFEKKSISEGTSGVVEKTDSTKSGDSLLKELETKPDSTDAANIEEMKKNYPLFAVLIPRTTPQGQLYPGPIVGTSHAKDTATVNRYFKTEAVKALLPRSLALKWTSKAIDKEGNYFHLIAIKISSRDGRAPLEGDVIVDARQDYEQYGSRPEVSMTMNSEGAKVWARLTKENIGKSVAIVLDGYVRSYPTVNTEITGGRSSITGLETVEEALDLANILKSGKMPASANIVQEQIVGPSLGKEAINSGMWSFILAFLLVLGYMVFFYSRHAGMAANIALLVNVFFMFGIMASMGAVLTLPGIAGIVLTLGMAVDANVLIYERIEEENLGGKGLKLAIADGYRHAYSAIIDGQVTTLLTGIVLYIFGSGPIKGFATTLIIGILTSLFTSIFISRLIFERRLAKNKPIVFTTKRTTQWLRTISIDFLGKRKLFYMISGGIMFVCVASMVFKGFNYGIDFSGGRSYIVKFDQKIKVSEVGSALNAVFGETPEVKTIGDGNQVKITTKYKIDESTAEVDNEVENMLYKGLQQGNLIAQSVSFDTFISDYRRSSEKVGPTVSDDIQKDAVLAVLLSLVMIFIYVAIRFNKWQYGLGGLVALFHDAMVVLGAYSLFSGIMPFSMEVDQSFIAAILTVIGFSINDTVVIFDRIREYLHVYPKRKMEENMNNAINNTMRRTFNTSMTVFVVLFAIFIFGGASMRGFIFALLVGTVAGVYSTVFIATPIAYDMQQKAIRKAAGKAAAEKK